MINSTRYFLSDTTVKDWMQHIIWIFVTLNCTFCVVLSNQLYWLQFCDSKPEISVKEKCPPLLFLPLPLWGRHEHFGFFFFQQRQLILTRTCHILPIQLDLFVHFVFWTALDRRDLSAISARISPDDIRLFAICRLLSFAFLLYHSSLQGMKMSNKWHHCHVWISFSLPGPLIW